MKKRREGVAMIVVMCVMLMVTALSLVLLLTASVMITNANRAGRKEQCRITAVAVSDLLIDEVDNFSAQKPYTDMPGQGENAAGEKTDLRGILGTVYTNEWPSFDRTKTSVLEGKKNRNILKYHLDGTDLPGDTVVELYWTQEDEEPLDRDNPDQAKDIFEEISLYIKVTNTLGEESSTVISGFQPKVDIDVVTNTWKSWTWHYMGHYWEGSDS